MLLGNRRYSFARSVDAGLRVTSLVYKNRSSGAVLYQEQPQYDAANSVVAATTTLPTGDTDVQAFCYDARNRLTWAGASGMPPCGSTLNAGTLTAAQYQQGYSYDCSCCSTASTSVRERSRRDRQGWQCGGGSWVR
ncbi:hypothetical protein KTAU_30020 [Thermogemmatispora aurantia]|uniref:hypothetical protein n=1 Tax=Thermogemmatispora aurantia TaxID=2045279 RepID=UPI00124E2714|nr:hypothetical protein [Thermogemmatispora aurantia]GER84366.1 hypothetical protein KTAU_30020 [Thermogemmatispora aurantia]